MATALLATSAMLAAAMHVISDLDPVQRRLSEYATGDAAWVMVVAFITLGMGIVTLGVAMATSGGAAGVATWLVVAAGVGIVVAGLFPTEPGAATTAEIVHSRSSAAATLLLVAASVIRSLPPAPRHRLVFAGVIVALALASGLLHETAVSGLSQRALWLALLAWLLLTARDLRPVHRTVTIT